MGRLVWIGVICCIGALALNLFPGLVYDLGMDRGGAWAFFAFGLFLILIGTLLSRRGCEHAHRQ